MKMDMPIGNNAYAPLFLRLALGSYFMLQGLHILDDLGTFIKLVQSFRVLPNQLATLYAILVPYLAIFSGGLMLLGFWTILAGLLMSLMLASFILALGLWPSSKEIFNKDVILLAVSISLMYSGAGAWSIDRWRRNS